MTAGKSHPSVRDHAADGAVEDRLLLLRLLRLVRVAAVAALLAHIRHIHAENAHVTRLEAEPDQPVWMPSRRRARRTERVREDVLAAERRHRQHRAAAGAGDL